MVMLIWYGVIRYPYRATFTAMFTLKHEKYYLLKNLLYTCVRKIQVWSSCTATGSFWKPSLAQHFWQILIYLALVVLKSKSYRVKTLLWWICDGFRIKVGAPVVQSIRGMLVAHIPKYRRTIPFLGIKPMSVVRDAPNSFSLAPCNPIPSHHRRCTSVSPAENTELVWRTAWWNSESPCLNLFREISVISHQYERHVLYLHGWFPTCFIYFHNL